MAGFCSDCTMRSRPPRVGGSNTNGTLPSSRSPEISAGQLSNSQMSVMPVPFLKVLAMTLGAALSISTRDLPCASLPVTTRRIGLIPSLIALILPESARVSHRNYSTQRHREQGRAPGKADGCMFDAARHVVEVPLAECLVFDYRGTFDHQRPQHRRPGELRAGSKTQRLQQQPANPVIHQRLCLHAVGCRSLPRNFPGLHQAIVFRARQLRNFTVVVTADESAEKLAAVALIIERAMGFVARAHDYIERHQRESVDDRGMLEHGSRVGSGMDVPRLDRAHRVIDQPHAQLVLAVVIVKSSPAGPAVDVLAILPRYFRLAHNRETAFTQHACSSAKRPCPAVSRAIPRVSLIP